MARRKKNPISLSDPPQITFNDLLKQRQWSDYSTFISEAPRTYIAELRKDLEKEQSLRKRLRAEVLEKRFIIRSYDEHLAEAEQLLFSGNVVGVDGTVSRVRTLSGLRCQIGIVAVNYYNEKLRQAYFISEAFLNQDIDDVVELLKRREARHRVLSDMVVRALMLYREREVAMRPEFRHAYRLMHGPLLPFELMTGLGRLRALEPTISVLERIVADERCFSIVSSSTQDDYVTLGSALDQGEYFVDESFSCGDEIAANEDFMAEKKWRPAEIDRVRRFLRDYGAHILTGVIKVSHRPYVFYAHRKSVDLAAGIIARDSLLQREKGFPLLIDYADSLCSTSFPSTDFASLLAYQLAKEGRFLAETSEQAMRLK